MTGSVFTYLCNTLVRSQRDTIDLYLNSKYGHVDNVGDEDDKEDEDYNEAKDDFEDVIEGVI